VTHGLPSSRSSHTDQFVHSDQNLYLDSTLNLTETLFFQKNFQLIQLTNY
jgi:hypothetical protein